MSLVIDLILVAIVAICGWRGFRTGIINGVSWILAIVIAIYGANLVATAYYRDVAEVMEPFALSVVENTMNGGSSADEEPDAVIDPSISVDERDRLDVYTVSMAVMTRLGITSGAADGIARETADSYEKVSGDMTQFLTNRLCDRAAFVALFAIGFALIAIVFTVIGNVIDLSFGIPGHENLNHITGAALGVIRGFLILMVLGCLGRYLGILLKPEIMEKTLILKTIITNNRLASLLKL